ncbi:MAG: nucleotidyltransferase [Nitrosotalea sp.]
MKFNYEARENEILDLLRRLQEEGIEFVLVGGYAVSALASHRFSVDCDLAVPKNSVTKIRSLLKSQLYKKVQERKGFDKVYGGSFESYVKKVSGLDVTLDLLIDSLVSRATEASWSYKEIKSLTSTQTVAGVSKGVESPVPSKEMMIAFKIHAGRLSDARDIVMLADGADWDLVAKLTKRGTLDAVKGNIDGVIKILEDKNTVDSLKGVYSRKGDVSKMLTAAIRHLKALADKI